MKEDSTRSPGPLPLKMKDDEAVVLRSDPSKGEIGKAAEECKKGKGPEDRNSWLGGAVKAQGNNDTSENNKIIPLTPPQITNGAAKVEPSNPVLPHESPSQRQEGLRYCGVLDGVERETLDRVMTTFVDESAERILTELQHEPWFHGALPLEDISALVASNGEFLIRELEPDNGRPPMPCLTVRLGSQLKDFPIHTVQVGEPRYFTIDGNHKAKTVVGIVQKHYEEKIVLQDDFLLLKPIPKQPWELSKDKIKLVKKLGEGAFGEVWQGTLRQSATRNIIAAIKVTKLKEDNKGYMQELYKEARLMRQYQHINVVGFFGMVMENDNVMIVMEMVNGGGLDHYLKKKAVSIPDKCSYSFDVALGLYYLHSKRCMHRDLACRNCLIDTEKNIVKISDFGLSKQADVYKIQPNEKVPTKWQAPEVVAKHVYTRECDVYSYGILVWEIFNNAKVPFEEYDNKTVRQRISDPKFRPALSEDLPSEIRVIVAACWSAVPENRPVMKEVAWILKRFQKHNTPDQVNKQPAPANPAPNPGGAPASASVKASKQGISAQVRKAASSMKAMTFSVRRERKNHLRKSDSDMARRRRFDDSVVNRRRRS